MAKLKITFTRRFKKMKLTLNIDFKDVNHEGNIDGVICFIWCELLKLILNCLDLYLLNFLA